MGDKILIVDDDPVLLGQMNRTLAAEGYQVLTAGDGLQAMRTFYQGTPHLAVVDTVIPELDGFDVCQRIRDMTLTPVILLTEGDREADIMKGLDRGADDFLAKPFEMQAFLARVQATLDRSRDELPSAGAVTYRDDHLSLNPGDHEASVGNQAVWLTPTEHRLLALLIEHKGQPLQARYLLEQVWGPAYAGEFDYLRLHFQHLRRRLEPEPAQPRYLCHEPETGYRFEPQP